MVFFVLKKVVSRYADIVTARVNTRQAVDELIANSSIPVVNALDDYGTLCQKRYSNIAKETY